MKKKTDIAEAIAPECNKVFIKGWKFKSTVLNNYWPRKKIKNIMYNVIQVVI